MNENLLKNWHLQWHGGAPCIVGNLYNDSKKRLPDGTGITTSRVKIINFETGVVETLNAVYNLEMESEENDY